MSNNFYYLDGNNKLTQFNNSNTDIDLTVKDLNCLGNLGIGTTTPHTDLHIIKDMHVFENINTITMNTNIYGCNINIRANDNLSLSIDGSTGTANQLLVTDGSKLTWGSMKPVVDLITGNPSYMFITKNNVKYRIELKDEPVIVKPNINYVSEITEFSQTQTIHPNFINFKIDTPLNILDSNNDIVVKRKYNRLALNDVVQDIVILDNSKSYTFDLNNDSLYSFPFMVKQSSSYGSTDVYDGDLTTSDYLVEGATTRNLIIPGNTLYGCYEYNTTVTNTNMGSYLNSINMDYVPTEGFVVKSAGSSVPIEKIVYDSSTMNFNINLQDGKRIFKDEVVSIEYTKAQGILDTFYYNTIINSTTTEGYVGPPPPVVVITDVGTSSEFTRNITAANAFLENGDPFANIAEAYPIGYDTPDGQGARIYAFSDYDTTGQGGAVISASGILEQNSYWTKEIRDSIRIFTAAWGSWTTQKFTVSDSPSTINLHFGSLWGANVPQNIHPGGPPINWSVMYDAQGSEGIPDYAQHHIAQIPNGDYEIYMPPYCALFYALINNTPS